MNIVIDGNAFLNVSVSIVKNILLKDRNIGDRYYVSDIVDSSKFLLKQEAKEQFKRFSFNYLGSIFAPFKQNISSVFIVFDSRSWRKQFIKDHAEEHGEGDFLYKGHRKYDDKSNLFFDYFQFELVPLLVQEYGVFTSRVPGAEGDDLIAFICESLNEDICIWSVDKDLTQLLESSGRNVILLMPKMMTKYKKLYTTADFKLTVPDQSFDLFEFNESAINNSSVTNVVLELLSKDYQHYLVDPEFDILTKILSGDDTDNIPRVHPKLTPTKVLKVIELLKETQYWTSTKLLIDSENSNFIELINSTISSVLKISNETEQTTVLSNLLRNRKLIRLSTGVIPNEIVSAMSKSLDLSGRRRFNYSKFKKNFKT